MKKLLSFILMATLSLSVYTGAVYASTTDIAKPEKSNALLLSGEPCPEDVKSLALQHLATMKSSLSANPEALGFSALEFSNLHIVNPFSIYVFDESLRLIPNDVHVFSLIYLDNIVGVIEVKYDAETDSYSFTFGKSYGDELNKLQSKYTGNDRGLIIGRMGDKLFATDGKDATILLEKEVKGSPTVTLDQINSSSAAIASKASLDYFYATDAIDGTILTPNDNNQNVSPLAVPNPLPVPHVEQTGVCGVAAWAAVLNYRFTTSYTNSTLATAMENGGYVNGSDGIPNMTDYRNYANDKYSAKVVFASSPPSFSTLRSTINAGKPIMGSWYSGPASDKVWHALIITGYIQKTSSHTYYLKNPWYKNTQTVTVTNANSVVYSDAGYTWNLSQSVY